MNASQKKEAFGKHYAQLNGKTVKRWVVDPSGDIGQVFGLEFTDGTTAWILRDPEGNGPGFLEIVKPLKMCVYSGCKNGAVMSLHQRVGKKQVLHVCDKHVPAWAREVGSTPIYTVEKL